ncbi:small RNA-binding protein 11, chloroplastic-like [Hibiscus syriacus]|uniref:small RNA-binding protein 11, chloroplastic-like n=1 Tax=Hibiscus syriacus TaxID=106335 RepID=UPI0019204BE3|nr:small RNA-binding protein 11, chloroplastic-like [Hibiscus syriacus]
MAALRRLIIGTSKPSSLLISHRGIASKLFVGGLSIYTTEKGHSDAFSQYGQVMEAKIVMDRVSDRWKGFGFANYASEYYFRKWSNWREHSKMEARGNLNKKKKRTLYFNSAGKLGERVLIR